MTPSTADLVVGTQPFKPRDASGMHIGRACQTVHPKICIIVFELLKTYSIAINTQFFKPHGESFIRQYFNTIFRRRDI